MIHFDPKIWKQSFISNKSNTAWRCGNCGVGSIQLGSEIKKAKNFAIRARCTNPECKQTYSMVGRVAPFAYGREMVDEYIGIDDYRLYVSHFYPELVMFELPVTLNDRVKLKIVRSFNHFWYDMDACANKIRQAIELIIDQRKGHGSTLHDKINSLRNELKDDLTDTLLALKWIGNDGSHVDRPFDKDEILDAYCLLVDTLNQLYPDESEKKRRESLVKLINEKKGIKNL